MRRALDALRSEDGRRHLGQLPTVRRAREVAAAWPEPPAGQDSVAGPNPLRELHAAHGSGAGLYKWEHYLDVYHRHLARFRGREVHVCEVGVHGGGSLQLWHDYFGPGCRVVGIDVLEECRSLADDRTTIVIGDQEDRALWRRLRDEHPPFDVVIDDGGHQAGQQVVTLEEALPHLNPGGVYVCEDVHRATNEFGAYLRALSSQLDAGDRAERPGGGLEIAASPFQRAVASVHLYPFLAVVETNPSPVDRFVAEPRGTDWPG